MSAVKSKDGRWFVPLLVVSVLMAFALFVGSIVFGVFYLMKSSDVYKMALVEAQTNEKSREALGPPINAGWYVTGNINMSGSSGHATLSIPVDGSKQGGTLYLEANKSAGQWKFDRLILQTKDDKIRISLLEKNPPKTESFQAR